MCGFSACGLFKGFWPCVDFPPTVAVFTVCGFSACGVFSPLIDMCVKKPTDEEEMLNVSGVGENKLKKYGQRFLKEIQEFTSARTEAVLSMPEENKDGID